MKPLFLLVVVAVTSVGACAVGVRRLGLRADRLRTFVDISLPLMRPGLANAFLITFIESIADFGNPIVLGGNFNVLSTEVFFSVVGAQLDQGRAATLGILLLLFALAAFVVQRRVLGRKVYTSMTGKGDAGLPALLPASAPNGCRASTTSGSASRCWTIGSPGTSTPRWPTRGGWATWTWSRGCPAWPTPGASAGTPSCAASRVRGRPTRSGSSWSGC